MRIPTWLGGGAVRRVPVCVCVCVCVCVGLRMFTCRQRDTCRRAAARRWARSLHCNRKHVWTPLAALRSADTHFPSRRRAAIPPPCAMICALFPRCFPLNGAQPERRRVPPNENLSRKFSFFRGDHTKVLRRPFVVVRRPTRLSAGGRLNSVAYFVSYSV